MHSLGSAGVELSQTSSQQKPKPRKVLRGDSAEELSRQEAQTPKHASPLDDLAPQAGSVGIELVNQSFISQVTNEHNAAQTDMIERSLAEDREAESTWAELATDGLRTAESSSIELRQMNSESQHSSEGAQVTNEAAPLIQPGNNSNLEPQSSSGNEHAILIAASEEEQDTMQDAPKQQSAASREMDRVWYKERPVQLTIAGYTLIAFLYNCSDELIPLFAAAPPSIGGVGLLANQLAVPLISSGIVLMWYAVYGYPWFQKKYGAIICCRIGLLATAPFILLIPVAHYASASVVASQAVLCVVLACKAMAATNSFSASMILVNNAAPMHALGKVNGTGQMLASFVRAVGPALAGVVWGSTAQLGLPGSQFISFAFVAAIACLTQFVYVFLKLPSLDR